MIFCRRFAAHLLDTIALRPDGYVPVVDDNYTHLIRFCRQHCDTFQALVSTVASKMLAHKELRTSLQAPLTQFLRDLRVDMRPSAFRQLYAKRMMPLVSLLSVTPTTTSPAELEPMLLPLYASDVEQFVVLITHFPRWLHLMERFEM